MPTNSLEQFQPAESPKSNGGESAIGRAAGEAYTLSGQTALKAAFLNIGDSLNASLPNVTIHDDTGRSSGPKSTGSDTVTQEGIDNYFSMLTGKPVHGNDPALVAEMNEHPGSTLSARTLDDQPTVSPITNDNSNNSPTTNDNSNNSPTTNDNPSQQWTQQSVDNYFSALTGKPVHGNDPALVERLNDNPGSVLGAQKRNDQPNTNPATNVEQSQQEPVVTQQGIDNYFSLLTGKPVHGNDPALVAEMNEHPGSTLSARPDRDEKSSGQTSNNNIIDSLLGF